MSIFDRLQVDSLKKNLKEYCRRLKSQIFIIDDCIATFFKIISKLSRATSTHALAHWKLLKQCLGTLTISGPFGARTSRSIRKAKSFSFALVQVVARTASQILKHSSSSAEDAERRQASALSIAQVNVSYSTGLSGTEPCMRHSYFS